MSVFGMLAKANLSIDSYTIEIFALRACRPGGGVVVLCGFWGPGFWKVFCVAMDPGWEVVFCVGIFGWTCSHAGGPIAMVGRRICVSSKLQKKEKLFLGVLEMAFETGSQWVRRETRDDIKDDRKARFLCHSQAKQTKKKQEKEDLQNELADARRAKSAADVVEDLTKQLRGHRGTPVTISDFLREVARWV